MIIRFKLTYLNE